VLTRQRTDGGFGQIGSIGSISVLASVAEGGSIESLKKQTDKAWY
jgi:hypothetical protein